VERTERHAERLRRDAGRLGLVLPDQRTLETVLRESARDAFGVGDGIVRVEWSRDRDGDATPTLSVSTRPLGAERETWRAADARAVHPGRGERENTKHVDVEAIDRARAERDAGDLDEMLLYDADGWLVEGTRTNLLVVDASDRLRTPDRALGPVEGLGLAIVRERVPRCTSARLSRDDVAEARELLGVNAVRGVVPIVELNGKPIADGRPGRWAERLRPLFGHV
jgi:D-alanine transaminase